MQPYKRQPNPLRGQMAGGYQGFKVAVAVIVFHFICKMLVQFADILLPFIMALLLVSVLEPVKQAALSVLEGTFLWLFRKLSFCSCFLRTSKKSDRNYSGTQSPRTKDVAELSEFMKRFCLLTSIFVTLLFAGRVFWMIGRIVWLSGEAVTHDFKYYQIGVQKRQEQMEAFLDDFGLANKVQLDMNHLARYALTILKYAAEFLTGHVFYTVSQICLMTIFVVFLLWSPVQRDVSPVMQGVFGSMELYLKLKTFISLGMGITNGTALAIVGLEIPAAWGLMTFLANYIPNIGGPTMSVLPCVIALLDVRKTLFQVMVAFLAQFFLHFTIANFVEPIVFGTTEEIHSVVVLLGLSFFGYLWGVTGMFLSVPLLFAIRAWLDTIVKNPKNAMEAREDARFVMGMLEGTWLSDSLDTAEEETDVNLLTGQIESNEGPLEFENSQPFTRNHSPPPDTTAHYAEDMQALLEVVDEETGEVRILGVIARWIFFIAAYIVLFLWADPSVLIHPSGGDVLAQYDEGGNSSLAMASKVSAITTSMPRLLQNTGSSHGL